MIADSKSNSQDRKLLSAFGVLILLTTVIGTIGILQVQRLSRRVEVLGRINLKLENAVLEMRVNNTIYAMGIRNYAYWKISRYLGSVPVAVNLNDILKAESRFREELKIYKDYAYTRKQSEWAKQAGSSFNELVASGKQIVALADSAQGDKDTGRINSILMPFENRLSKLDEFLDSTMSKANLSEVQAQIETTYSDRLSAIISLTLGLASTIIIELFIALSVYFRRKRERAYREGLFNQVINMEEYERKNLSTAVHDQMGQDLSALKIYLGIIEQGILNQPQEIKDKISGAKKIISELIEKSHNIALLLRPPDLDEVGLLESIESLLIDYKHVTSVNYVYQKPESELKLSPQYSLLIYRIAQELLTNMAKHSQAKNVEISLKNKNRIVEFFYKDDGSGFDYAEITKAPHRRKDDQMKLGLLGLKERVELLDGVMKIDSGHGKGTQVKVMLNI